jgi:hypothetical protein
MKKNNLRGLAVSILSIALIISIGCEGPTGNDGPAGAQGPQGEVGPQGPQGPEGTANVIYSDWIGFDVSNWSEANSAFGQMRRDYPVMETAINDEILSMGTVAVYVRIPGNASIQDKVFYLPWIYNLTKGVAQRLAFELSPQTINIYLHDLVDQSADPGTFGNVVEYRYVIIPGGTAAKQVFANFSNYQETMEFYSIEL